MLFLVLVIFFFAIISLTFFWFLRTIFYSVPIHPSISLAPFATSKLSAISIFFPFCKEISFYFLFALTILLVLMFQTLSRCLPYAAILSWLIRRSDYHFCIVIFDKFFFKWCLISTSLGTYVSGIDTITNRSCEKESVEMPLFLSVLLRIALHLQKGLSSK